MQDRQGSQSIELGDLEQQIINEYQKGLPLSATPYADMADALGVSEQLVLQALERLQNAGVVTRVGPVFAPKSIGASTLAAMAVPAERLAEVAGIISAFDEVNHNYEREHDFNLWFVVTAPDQQHLDQVLERMQEQTGCPVLDLPLLKEFHIDLGFPLWC